MKYRILITLALLMVTLPAVAADRGSTGKHEDAQSQSSVEANRKPEAGEMIVRQVVSSGGSSGGTSTNFGVSGTIGQTAVGGGNSTSYGVGEGFWRGIGNGGPAYLCGDADGNASISIGDAVYVINFIFGGGPAPDPLLAADADCSGGVSIGDAVYIINFIFGGGPAPCANCP